MIEKNVYRNRELSWLKFNERVLEEAESEYLEHYFDSEMFITMLADNTQAREMTNDGTYIRLTPGENTPLNSQEFFYDTVGKIINSGEILRGFVFFTNNLQHIGYGFYEVPLE